LNLTFEALVGTVIRVKAQRSDVAGLVASLDDDRRANTMSDHHNQQTSQIGFRKGLRRRDFVAGSLAAGAGLAIGSAAWNAWSQAAPPTPAPTIPIECVPPVPFGPASAFATPGGPVRIRKSVFELDPNEITRLKAAYAELLKITNNSDPRGWYRQGAVHCWYCSGPQTA
jgi:hypothetical protein